MNSWIEHFSSVLLNTSYTYSTATDCVTAGLIAATATFGALFAAIQRLGLGLGLVLMF
jgi:hypothetical protein